MSLKSLQHKFERQLALIEPENDLETIRQWYFQEETSLLPHDKSRLIVLSNRQETAKKRYEVIFGMLVDGLPSTKIVKLIKKQFKIESDGHAYQLIRHTKELYGDLHEVHKTSLRTIQIERRRRLVRAIKDADMDEADRYKLIHLYEERIEKLGGLDDPDAISMKELLAALQEPDIVYSTDPKTLDVAHEDVTEEEEA